MAAILLKSNVEGKPNSAACMGVNMKEAAGRLEVGMNKVKAAFFDKIENSKIATQRFVKHGRYAMEDGLEEAVRKVKREPVKFLAIAFSAGLVFGMVLPKFGRRSA